MLCAVPHTNCIDRYMLSVFFFIPQYCIYFLISFILPEIFSVQNKSKKQKARNYLSRLQNNLIEIYGTPTLAESPINHS